MTTPTTIAGIALCGLLACAGARAQDPEQAVKKILDEVAEEMREIDRLLLSSGTTGAAQAMERTAEKLQKLMDETQTSQGKVVRGIEKLIEELQNMQSNSRSQQQQQGEQQDPQQRPDGEQQNQQQSTRRQTETPDLVRQNRPGEQPQPKPQGQQNERNEQDPANKGQNVKSEPKAAGATEEVDRESTSGQWGNLPDYVQFLHSRGGVPDVPEKYRRLLEAYQKQSHASKKD